MDDSAFDLIEQTARSQDPEAVLDCVAALARGEGNYHLLFSLRILRVRRRLGLPFLDPGDALSLAGEPRRIYEQAFREAARESGELLLHCGDIPAAWQYFKALDEPGPVASAIEALEDAERCPNLDRIIHIAYQEGVSRRRGFELCLQHHGLCTAITWYGANPDPESRQECLNLLVANVYETVAAALRETVAANEGVAPAGDSIARLIAGRDWLFEGVSSYIDSTHLTSVLRFAPELRDGKALRMAVELAEYGQRLNPMFHFRGDPPFEDTYRDHAAYLRALSGDHPEQQIEHFRNKIRPPADAASARVLVELLVRLERYDDAIDAAIEYLAPENAPENAGLILQLCQMAGDFRRLREVARQQKDLLAYAAGVIQDQQREK